MCFHDMRNKTKYVYSTRDKIIPDARLWLGVSGSGWGAAISALIAWNQSSLNGSGESAAISI